MLLLRVFQQPLEGQLTRNAAAAGAAAFAAVWQLLVSPAAAGDGRQGAEEGQESPSAAVEFRGICLQLAAVLAGAGVLVAGPLAPELAPAMCAALRGLLLDPKGGGTLPALRLLQAIAVASPPVLVRQLIQVRLANKPQLPAGKLTSFLFVAVL